MESSIPLNPAAGNTIIYEVQLRSANACREDLGSSEQRAACRRKTSPKITYRAEKDVCPADKLGELTRIKLGTIDDFLRDTAHYKDGITLKYIKEKVGANMVWIMPPFPNNDSIRLPSPCDNLGSPYAVRDYFHIRGTLDSSCIDGGRDEHSETPCYGNDKFKQLIDRAHAMGLKVMLDVAFNHFGHGYSGYDVEAFTAVRDRIGAGEDLGALNDFAATRDQALIYPTLLDTEDKLKDAVQRLPALGQELAQLKEKCRDLSGDKLVRAFHAFRLALNHERRGFSCEDQTFEARLSSFFLARNGWDASQGGEDFYEDADWKDVKFIYHQSRNENHRHSYLRNREYLFRVLNYWTAQGIDGFRLDHTTEDRNGLDPGFWGYVLAKNNYYAAQRGQKRPIYLAEEFSFHQEGMSHFVDVMTDGYVHNVTKALPKRNDHEFEPKASHYEWALNQNDRHGGRMYTMTALETHDEHRVADIYRFPNSRKPDFFLAATAWGIGATSWSTPMILMGQEFGEPWGLGFKRSDLLRSRFEGSQQYFSEGDSLRSFYQVMMMARQKSENRALWSDKKTYLRRKDNNRVDEGIFAQAKWSDDCNVIFAFHKLVPEEVKVSFFLDDAIETAQCIQGQMQYQLVDVLGNVPYPLEALYGQKCVSGDDLKWEFKVKMADWQKALWLRLESCPQS